MASHCWFTNDIIKSLRIGLGVLLAAVVFFGQRGEAKDLQPQITFSKGKLQIESKHSKKKKIINVEFAETQPQQQKGLMYRSSLSSDEGMLFLFEVERTLGFWMKNTYIDLDIAYIDKNFRIVDIQQMKATSSIEVGDPPAYPSKKPAQYALEMNKNWFQNNKFKVGDLVKIIKN
jgi:uncharacterized protein